MKKILKISVIIIALIAGLFVARNMAIQTAVQTGVRFMTGLKLNMHSFHLSILGSSIGMRDLALFNPRGFRDPVMVEMPEVYVDYELAPLFQGNVHLKEVRIYLKEFVVVKNEKGQLNLDSLKAVQTQKKEQAAPKTKARPAAGGVKGKVPKMRIDVLKLRIEKVIYKDYSRAKNKPFVQEFNMNLNESYANITNPYGIVSLIVVKVLMNTSIARLTGFDLGSLEGSVSDVLASSRKIAADAVTDAFKTLGVSEGEVRRLMEQAPIQLKETTSLLQKQTEGITHDLSDTAESLKGKLKLPFGKQE